MSCWFFEQELAPHHRLSPPAPPSTELFTFALLKIQKENTKCHICEPLNAPPRHHQSLPPLHWVFSHLSAERTTGVLEEVAGGVQAAVADGRGETAAAESEGCC